MHLNDIYDRARNEVRQSWTQPAVAGPRYTGRPLYLVTSARTFGGGEELTYNLRAQERATVVGETTGGGANQASALPVGGGFVALFATGRAINPVTRTNWDGAGVKPDLATPAAQALDAAYTQALRAILKSARDEEDRRVLTRLLASLEKKPRR